MLEIISTRNDTYILNDMQALVALVYVEYVLRTREPIIGSVGKVPWLILDVY